MNEENRSGTYRAPPIRPELLAAHEEMRSTAGNIAFAVCRTWDGTGWEVNTKQGKHGNLFSTLPGSYASQDEATAAGVAWLLNSSANGHDPHRDPC